MFPVHDGHPPGAESHHLVLPVFCVSLNHNSTLTPSFWMVAQQVLNEYTVTNFKRWQLLGLLAEPVMSWGQCQLSPSSHRLPHFLEVLRAGDVRFRLGWNEIPSSISAGDNPVSGSGVFLSCSKPFTNLTVLVLSFPVRLTASLITLLAAATDLSAFWLAVGIKLMSSCV